LIELKPALLIIAGKVTASEVATGRRLDAQMKHADASLDTDIGPMSAFDGGLKRSTQHFISDASDGVDGDGPKICSRVQRGGQGGVVEPLAVRIRSSTEWLGNAMNGRARLWASKPEPNEI
jgi:hypothetical protein